MSELLVSACPTVAAFWTKECPPLLEVSATSRTLLRLSCPSGHTWVARASALASRGQAVCARCEYARSGGFAATYPDLAAEYHPSNLLPIERVHPNSAKTVCWRCSAGHEWWEKIVRRTTREAGCPVCHPVRPARLLVEVNPLVAALWDEERNRMPVDQVSASASRRAHFRCERGHAWSEFVWNAVRRPGCKYCLRRPKGEPLSVTHPELAAQWSARNPIFPDDVDASCRELIRWECPDCTGSYLARVADRVAGHGHHGSCQGVR